MLNIKKLQAARNSSTKGASKIAQMLFTQGLIYFFVVYVISVNSRKIKVNTSSTSQIRYGFRVYYFLEHTPQRCHQYCRCSSDARRLHGMSCSLYILQSLTINLDRSMSHCQVAIKLPLWCCKHSQVRVQLFMRHSVLTIRLGMLANVDFLKTPKIRTIWALKKHSSQYTVVFLFRCAVTSRVKKCYRNFSSRWKWSQCPSLTRGSSY